MRDLETLLAQMTLEEKIGQMSQLYASKFEKIPDEDITMEDDAVQAHKFSKHTR